MSFLVLLNSKGQTARVIPFGKKNLEVVYRFDNKRIELLPNTDHLTENEIEFKSIATVEKDSKPGDLISKGTWGQIKHVENVDAITADVKERKEDDVRDFPFFLQWTSGIQVAALAIILGIGWYLASHKDEQTQVVKVFQRPKTITPVVELNNRQKLKEVVRYSTKKVVKPPTKTTNISAVKQKGNNIRSGNQLKEMGALSALGGMNKNSKGLGGLSQTKSNSSGYGFDATRASGGNARGLLGKGLVQAGIGNTEKLSGYGGYGTHGKGQGQAAYGAMNMAGQSGGYFLPLSEEAMIEGGLDPDQIDAVIQRNRGKLTYCYEKALQTKPNIAGRVGVDFVISPNGDVSLAKVSHTSTKSSQIDSCIVEKLKGLQFPKPRGNVSVKVYYPFTFQKLG